MTAKRRENTDLDDLLKRALADDLPADVAAGMRGRIDRFPAGISQDEKRPAAWIWLFRRAVWPALSVLMLVSGSLLQGLGARNLLAERISLVGIRQVVEDRLAAAVSMSCSVRVRDDKGEFSSCEVVWRSGSDAEVQLRSPDGSSLGTFKLKESGGSADPRIRTAALFSSPDTVRNLLDGDWRLVEFSEEAGFEAGTFTTPARAFAEPIEFTIDLRADLPVRITRRTGGVAAAGGTGDILWDARFTFPAIEREERKP